MGGSIFISYASADRDYVDRIISFLEAHHFRCWVSFRDVAVGENYQEAITRALRSAEALMVIFSSNANQSIEIQKELSLASRYKLRVVPLRMENVEPSDALTYELATHQWIDIFRSWEAGCDRLLSELAAIVPAQGPDPQRGWFRGPDPPGVPSPALLQAMATQPAEQVTSSAPNFIAPRQLSTAREADQSGESATRAAAGSAPVIPSLAVITGSLNSPLQVEPLLPPNGGGFIGLATFTAVVLVFALLLVNSLGKGEPSLLELFFWGILLLGCARLVRAILRVLTGDIGAKRA
jgi:hypothetical protein